MGLASDEYRFIASQPHRVLLYYCGRLKLSYGPVLLVLPVLLVMLYCCGRLKLSDDHALRVLRVLLYY